MAIHKEEKVLTVCSRGNSRSVALAFLLKAETGADAIACGVDSASLETLMMLYEWADRIILTTKEFEDRIPSKYKEKLSVWDVGGDRFFRGFEPELLDMYRTYMEIEDMEKI